VYNKKFNYFSNGLLKETREMLANNQTYTYLSYYAQTAINVEQGNIVESRSYDAWGRHRHPNTWDYLVHNPFGMGGANDITLRGYTFHEHLPHFSLINMNGRLYDYVLGRMLSPDNYVQSPDNTQSFNRYSYCWNNPLKYTDPSGEIITWNIGKGGLSVGLNFTPVGVPLGFGINVGWANGGSVGIYGEVGYRVGGTGFGKGAAVSQSLDYNFKQADLSTTSSASAYTSFGAFNAGVSYSKTYSFGSKQWSNGNWAVSGGLGIGTARSGLGINVSYGSGGWSYGMGGYFNPDRPKVYKSPISDNYGNQNGECALRCLEEFSKSYGMDDYNYDYWLEQNEGKLGVHGNNIEGLIDNTGVFKSDPILPISDICAIPDAFTNDKRVMMGFETPSGGEHAVMVSKVKIWSNGNYKIYFSETSPVRIAPYSTSNLFNLSGARFWTFYR
jgi:RHS repeat-associated protein